MMHDLAAAREAMKRGASLQEVAIKGEFDRTSDLDLALWYALGDRKSEPAPVVATENLPTLKDLLAKRDAKIRQLLSEGYSITAMAERFGLTEKTIVNNVLCRPASPVMGGAA